MEKAKKFICACLNGDRKGVIYFGVEDNQREGSKFRHGEITGLDVEDIKDDITKAFQDLLDNHIKSDGGPLQKGGEQDCVNLYFVPVKSKGDKVNPYVIEKKLRFPETGDSAKIMSITLNAGSRRRQRMRKKMRMERKDFTISSK